MPRPGDGRSPSKRNVAAIKVGGTLRRQRHRDRLEHPPPPDIEADDALRQAWHAMQLHWLATVPGYREQVRAKLHAAIDAEIKAHGACKGCGCPLVTYTSGCAQCWSRRKSRAKRARDVDNLPHDDPCG